jgi:hypothetical protein
VPINSTVSAVKVALKNALTTGLPTTQIIYGGRNSVTLTGEQVVAVGDVTGNSTVASMDPDGDIEEVYDVEIIASAAFSGADQQAATEAALALWQAVRTYLGGLADETLGVAGVFALRPLGDWSLRESATERGRSAAVIFQVRVQAFIS